MLFEVELLGPLIDEVKTFSVVTNVVGVVTSGSAENVVSAGKITSCEYLS